MVFVPLKSAVVIFLRTAVLGPTMRTSFTDDLLVPVILIFTWVGATAEADKTGKARNDANKPRSKSARVVFFDIFRSVSTMCGSAHKGNGGAFQCQGNLPQTSYGRYQ